MCGCALPRFSIRTERSTPTICARRRRRIISCSAGKHGVRGVYAAIHLPRLPLCGTDRACLRRRPKTPLTALVLHTDAPFTAKLADRQRDDQPALEQHSLGPAIELCRRAHRLPAARRAAGMDGRRAGLLAHGQLQHGPRRLLAEVCRRHARHAGGNAFLRHLLAGHRDARMRAGRPHGATRA